MTPQNHPNLITLF